MTRVTQSENRRFASWHWSAVGLGEFASRYLQRKLDKKSAGRGSCCENEELMSDLWFDGFPEPIEQKQVILAIYREQDDESEAQTVGRLSPVNLHLHENKLRPGSENGQATSITKIAA